MLYEYRSDDKACLDQMRSQFMALVDEARCEDAGFELELVGERPCAAGVDPEKELALTNRAAAAIKKHAGLEIGYGSGSTDCNIPLSMGIPAVCFGCYIGGGAHTREEYCEIDSLAAGYRIAYEMILHHF